MTARLALAMLAGFLIGATLVWQLSDAFDRRVVAARQQPAAASANGRAAAEADVSAGLAPTERRPAEVVAGPAAEAAGTNAAVGTARPSRRSDVRGAGPIPAAIAAAGAIDDDVQRDRALSAAYRQWARSDPAGFLAHLSDFSLTESYHGALRLAAEADPELALRAAETITGPTGRAVRAAALETIATHDPEAALAHLTDQTDERDALLAAVATGFARGDLERAVAWLTALEDADGAAFYPVIRALALVDLEHAIELDAWAFELDYEGPQFGDISWLRASLERHAGSPASIADQVAGSTSKGLLAEALSWWAVRDPYAAIDWMSDQKTIPGFVVERVAAELAKQGFEQAIGYATLMPSGLRAAWIEDVLANQSSFDLAGALDALQAYRFDPFYQDALGAILRRGLGDLSPVRVAELAGPEPSAEVIRMIMGGWVELEPVVAANWALSLADPEAREQGVSVATNHWLRSDPYAGLGWIDGIADPTLRNRLRSAFCSRSEICEAAP